MLRFSILSTLLLSLASCQAKQNSTPSAPPVTVSSVKTEANNTLGIKKAFFASGCFWCVEAIFESVIGVKQAVSGYAGGTKEDATYEQVSAGLTDHAETVMVEYDPNLVSFAILVDVFFDSHNPTTKDQQGPDRGRQYRSAIFYTSEEERRVAMAAIEKINSSKMYKAPVVTEVTAFSGFYPAEEYHQDFEKRNPNQGYVRAVSIPRLTSFQKKRPELIKKTDH